MEKSKVEIDFIHNSISLNLKFRTEAKGEPKLQSSIPAVAIQNKAATKPKRNGSNVDWRTFGLNKHNEYRKQHHSPPLVLDPKVTTPLIIANRYWTRFRPNNKFEFWAWDFHIITKLWANMLKTYLSMKRDLLQKYDFFLNPIRSFSWVWVYFQDVQFSLLL